MNRAWKNSEKIITVCAVLVLMFVVVGTTYSYFTVSIIGNETATSTNVSTGLLNIDFDASEYFNNSNMMLIDDSNRATEAEKITFNISHMADSTVPANYLIYFNNIVISNNFKSADLRWELLKDGTALSSGNFGSIGVSTEISLTSSAVALPLGASHDYELRIWLSKTSGDQLSLLGGSLSGKVAVSVVAQ